MTMYSYRILNYPDIPENVFVNLLFDDHLMIGADITYNDAENGFTRPLMGETIQSGLNIRSGLNLTVSDAEADENS